MTEDATPAKNCSNCKHSFTDRANIRSKFCRRYPPNAMIMPGPMGQAGIAGQFPPVMPHFTCGEHSPLVTVQ